VLQGLTTSSLVLVAAASGRSDLQQERSYAEFSLPGTADCLQAADCIAQTVLLWPINHVGGTHSS
jgi:hypothetical protein